MRPLRIELEGFLSYRDRTEVDLSDVGAAAILGANGAGKTSLVEAMTWALYGEGRGRGPDEMVNPEATRAVVALEFALGSTYRVSRERTVGKTPRSALSLDRLDLEHEPGGTWEPIGHPNIVDTQAAIVDLLGMTFATWEATSYIGQGRADAFTRLKPADRKRLLGEVLELDRYAELASMARAAGATAKGRAEEVARRVTLLKATADRRNEVHLDLVEAEAIREDAAERVQERQEAAEEATAASVVAEERVSRAREGLERTGRVRGRLRGLQAEEDALELEEPRLEALILSVADFAREADRLAGSIRLQEAAVREASEGEGDRRREVATLAERLAGIKVDDDQHAEQIERLSAAGAACPLCSRPMDDVERRSVLAVAVAARQGNAQARETTLAQIAKLEQEADSLREYRREAERRHERDVAAARDIERRLEEVERARTKLEEHNARRQVLLAEIAELNREMDSIEKGPSIDKAEAEAGEARSVSLAARNRLSSALQDLQEAGARVGMLSERMAQIEAAEGALEAAMREGEEARLEATVAGMAERAFGRDGIPALLIETAIPEIEGTANELLATLTSGRLSVSLQTLGVKKTGGTRETLDILVGDDLDERPLEALSGGERQMVDLALRIALARLLAGRAGRKIEALIIDEGFTALDEAHRQRTVEAFSELARAFPLVLAITHLRDLAETFPTTFVVENAGGSSTVRREG